MTVDQSAASPIHIAIYTPLLGDSNQLTSLQLFDSPPNFCLLSHTKSAFVAFKTRTLTQLASLRHFDKSPLDWTLIWQFCQQQI